MNAEKAHTQNENEVIQRHILTNLSQKVSSKIKGLYIIHSNLCITILHSLVLLSYIARLQSSPTKLWHTFQTS